MIAKQFFLLTAKLMRLIYSPMILINQPKVKIIALLRRFHNVRGLNLSSLLKQLCRIGDLSSVPFRTHGSYTTDHKIPLEVSSNQCFFKKRQLFKIIIQKKEPQV